jgi:hypothetical protein
VGRPPAARSGLGPWVGARVASPRCPILRPGSLNVHRSRLRNNSQRGPWRHRPLFGSPAGQRRRELPPPLGPDLLRTARQLVRGRHVMSTIARNWFSRIFGEVGFRTSAPPSSYARRQPKGYHSRQGDQKSNKVKDLSHPGPRIDHQICGRIAKLTHYRSSETDPRGTGRLDNAHSVCGGGGCRSYEPEKAVMPPPSAAAPGSAL